MKSFWLIIPLFVVPIVVAQSASDMPFVEPVQVEREAVQAQFDQLAISSPVSPAVAAGCGLLFNGCNDGCAATASCACGSCCHVGSCEDQACNHCAGQCGCESVFAPSSNCGCTCGGSSCEGEVVVDAGVVTDGEVIVDGDGAGAPTGSSYTHGSSVRGFGGGGISGYGGVGGLGGWGLGYGGIGGGGGGGGGRRGVPFGIGGFGARGFRGLQVLSATD